MGVARMSLELYGWKPWLWRSVFQENILHCSLCSFFLCVCETVSPKCDFRIWGRCIIAKGYLDVSLCMNREIWKNESFWEEGNGCQMLYGFCLIHIELSDCNCVGLCLLPVLLKSRRILSLSNVFTFQRIAVAKWCGGSWAWHLFVVICWKMLMAEHHCLHSMGSLLRLCHVQILHKASCRYHASQVLW